MDWDKQITDEWRKLGFYYQRNDELKQWRLVGSKAGLTNFVNILFQYSNDPALEGISEHIHLGWYQYLEIMTWHEPLISHHAIGGSLSDIGRLKTMIEYKISGSSKGETFVIGSDYAPNSDYIIQFFIMADDFDPASMESK